MDMQVADSAASMGVGGLKAEVAATARCRKGDVHNLPEQSLLVEP